MGFLRQIQLLLWKNWTLRKRQKVKTGSRVEEWGGRREQGGGEAERRANLPFSSEVTFSCSVTRCAPTG